MEYRVLGPLELGGRNGPIVLEGRRERAVLSALALGRGRVVSTERLLEIVWGDSPPRSAAKTVQNHVLRLRKSLGADAIETREPGYRLVVDTGDIDADRFEQLAASGRAHLAASEPEAAAEAFRSARSLWRGRPFPELEESAEAAAEAQRLSELERVVSEELMAAELACGRHHAAVAELEALVAS
jgi:DNA-binding SARP family transcriptional activator